MKKYIISLCLFSLTGCSCVDSYAPQVDIVRYEDKYLNCQGILHSLNEAESMLYHSQARCRSPHVFANNTLCTPMVKMDAARNQYAIGERINYLLKLGANKGCSKMLHEARQKYMAHYHGAPLYHPHGVNYYAGYNGYAKDFYLPSSR